MENIFLIDEPIEGDRRVQSSYSRFCRGGRILNIRNLKVTGKDIAFNLHYFFFFFSFFLFYRDFKAGVLPIISPYLNKGLCGILNLFRDLYLSYSAFCFLKQKYGKGVCFIYSNDLMCGCAACMYSRYNKECFYYYDSHELQLSRNRKSSYVRAFLEFVVEKSVVKYADKIIVVNSPAKGILVGWYNCAPEKVIIINNCFYEKIIDASTPKSYDPALLYIGKGFLGRYIDEFFESSLISGCDCYIFSVGVEVNPSFLNFCIVDSCVEYQRVLQGLIGECSFFMWCCLEDKCLGYKYALPNKFFQAMILNIPVVVTEGTYLAELVVRYQLGFVISPGQVFDVSLVTDEQYYSIKEKIAGFNALVSNCEIVL